MGRRVFTDQNVNPTDTLLRKALGSAIAYYMTIIETSIGFRKRWQYVSGNGWLLKVYDSKKTLYYLIACEDGILVNLTIRDTEMELFLQNEELSNIQTELKYSTKYSDGYALRFEIKSVEESRFVADFLKILMKERMSKQEPIRKALHPMAKRAIKQV